MPHATGRAAQRVAEQLQRKQGGEGFWYSHTIPETERSNNSTLGSSKDNIDSSRDNISSSRDNIGTSRDNIGTSRDNISSSRDNIGSSRNNSSSNGNIDTNHWSFNCIGSNRRHSTDSCAAA
ncbi:unnamed protein product [Closterium sp. NIES-53]